MSKKAKRDNKRTKHRLSLSMIIKNEEKFLEGCLESVKGVVDEIVIADTGSTDSGRYVPHSEQRRTMTTLVLDLH